MLLIDKSDEIVLKIVELAKEVAKIPAAFPGAAIADQPVKPFEVDVVIDPTDPDDVKWFDSQFGQYVKMVIRSPDLSASEPATTSNQASGDGKLNKDSCDASLCFRPALPYRLNFVSKLTPEDGVRPTLLASIDVLLPNQAPVLGLDVTRAAFVKMVTTVDFEIGVFKEIAVEKPSSVLAFA